MKVLDLFCGMGGFSLGFVRAGFTVEGLDANPHCVTTYRHAVGPADKSDLRVEIPSEPTDILLGGPPCRPWSRLNVQTNRQEHPDRPLVKSFTDTLLAIEPQSFLLENVPLLEKDSLYEELLESAGQAEYDCESRNVTYSDFGAATSRRRLILFGSRVVTAAKFWDALDSRKAVPETVRHALVPYWHMGERQAPDHEWPKLKTIGKYREKYRTGKFGWYQLKPDGPAPSFGNINKTYTLHPDSFDGAGPRVLSVREAMALMGFDNRFAFPKGVPITAKYRMVADTVSPKFSEKCAQVLKDLMT